MMPDLIAKYQNLNNLFPDHLPDIGIMIKGYSLLGGSLFNILGHFFHSGFDQIFIMWSKLNRFSMPIFSGHLVSPASYLGGIGGKELLTFYKFKCVHCMTFK